MQKEKYVEENYKDFIRNLNEALDQSEKDFQEGRYYDAKEVFKELRRKYDY